MTAIAKRTTRQHRSGNSFSVRLPRDMAYADPHQELEIEVVGNTRVLRPVQKGPGREAIEEMFRKFAEIGSGGDWKEALERPLGRSDPWTQR